MNKRSSVIVLATLLVGFSLFIMVTPPSSPLSATRRKPLTDAATATISTSSSSTNTLLNEARNTLRDANRTYQSAANRIAAIIKYQHRDAIEQQTHNNNNNNDHKNNGPTIPPLPSSAATLEANGGTSKFCAMRPGACEFNDQQRDAINKWQSSTSVTPVCRAAGTLGRSADQPVTIQLMDDLGGWSHIIPPIMDATNNGICNTHCRVTGFGGGDESRADILLTSLYHEPANLPRSNRREHQIMAAIGLEAWPIKPAMFDQMDILMSHHPQSQVPVNYYYGLGERCSEADKANPDEPLLCLDRSVPRFSEKRDDAYSGLFITNCNAKIRKGYLKELGEHIPLHSYGSCLHTAGLSSLQGQGSKKREAEKYKFFISFENTVLDGYLTEKFFEGFSMNTLMVYWGAPDMEPWLPANHSAINAHDFAGPKELAAFLKTVAASEHKWNSYFEWKKNNLSSMRPSFTARAANNLSNRGKNNIFCRVCDYYAKQYCSS